MGGEHDQVNDNESTRLLFNFFLFYLWMRKTTVNLCNNNDIMLRYQTIFLYSVMFYTILFIRMCLMLSITLFILLFYYLI